MRVAAVTEPQRARHEEAFGRRLHQIGNVGEMAHADEGDIVADVDKSQFAHDFPDRIGDDDFARCRVGLPVHDALCAGRGRPLFV